MPKLGVTITQKGGPNLCVRRRVLINRGCSYKGGSPQPKENQMIKVTSSKDEEKKSGPAYPCLKKSKSGRIVLFFGPCCGYELIGGEYPNRTWHESNDWTEDDFSPFTGTLELSNE